MKTENAKTENAKPRRVKMIYKVAELPHVFFNRACPDGARAGEHALVCLNTLWHESGHAAAAFLQDAAADDGRPAVVIMPAVHGGRWGPYGSAGLQAAVPDTVQHVQLEQWALDCRQQSALATSAGQLVAAYFSAVERVAMQSVNGVGDVEGVDPLCLEQFGRTINALLALRWSDAIAQERARVKWQELRARWQLAADGGYSRDTVRAIAQRELITKQAQDALPALHDYFSQRAARSKIPQRAALLREKSASNLQRAIAAVLRAGLPAAMLHGLPANMAGVIVDDEKAAQMINALHAAPGALRRSWYHALRGGVSLPPDYLKLPKRWAERFTEAKDYANKKRCRDSAIDTVSEAASAAATISAALPELLQLCEQHAAGTFPLDNVELREHARELRNNLNAASNTLLNRGPYARDITRGHAAWLKTPAADWLVRETREQLAPGIMALSDAITLQERSEKWQEKITAMRAELHAAFQRVIETPRAVFELLDNSRQALAGWQWNDAPADARAELRSMCTTYMQNAQAQFSITSELDEWKAGGRPPHGMPGDWLLISGRRARTTRGAEVPTRAVRYALQLLDAETETAVDFRERGLMIGSYQLTRRAADGTVHIGCHAFSPEAVQHVRVQLEKSADDTAQESTEVAA